MGRSRSYGFPWSSDGAMRDRRVAIAVMAGFHGRLCRSMALWYGLSTFFRRANEMAFLLDRVHTLLCDFYIFLLIDRIGDFGPA